MLGSHAHRVARTNLQASIRKAQAEGRRADTVRLKAELIEMDRQRATAWKSQLRQSSTRPGR